MSKKPTLRLRTHMSYEQLEKLLELKCQRPVQVLFDGLIGEGADSRKVMTLVFENEQDRDSLRSSITSSRST